MSGFYWKGMENMREHVSLWVIPVHVRWWRGLGMGANAVWLEVVLGRNMVEFIGFYNSKG